MTPTEIFDHLAARGLTVEQAVAVTDLMLADTESKQANASIVGQIAKFAPAAVEWLQGRARDTMNMGREAINIGLPVAAAAYGLPFLGGYTVGDMIAGSMEPDRQDIADIQEQELIRELEANAEQVRRRTQLLNPA